MPNSIHQLLEVFDEADAQGAMALRLRDIFRRWGFASEIYAGIVASGRAGALALSSLEEPGDREDILVFHYSIGAGALEGFLRTLRRQVIVYHNVTPAEYFEGWDARAAGQCRRGRHDLSRLLPTCDLALAVSRFNAAELAGLGFPRVAVLPFPVDFARLDRPAPARPGKSAGRRDGPGLLFVGRIAPNKRLEEIVRAFYFFQKCFQPSARLTLVGAASLSAYSAALNRLVGELRLEGSVRFSGKVSAAELAAAYRSADLFLCLSDHEGFGVPLLEAMHCGVPVVAFAAGAVPETLGKAGLLIDRKEPAAIAVLLNRLLADPDLRNAVLESQARRIKAVAAYPFEEKLRQALMPLL